ncbi:putative O-methyltransferase [Phytobacter ursingii]|nr:putative O-methyltransferase [Phytobacter ursingii]
MTMTTLTTAPLSLLLERLFAEAEATTSTALDNVSEEEQMRLLQSKTDYRDLYGRLKDLWLPVSKETGTLLYMLARSSNAHTIVEYGTSFGISALHMAAALRDNGGGRLITCEFEPSKAARARQHFNLGGVSDLIEIREGDALETLRQDLPDTIDLVLLDGAKSLYPEILDLLEPRLRKGALIVADNADYYPPYLEKVRAPENGYLSTPFSEDVELSVWLG